MEELKSKHLQRKQLNENVNGRELKDLNQFLNIAKIVVANLPVQAEVFYTQNDL